MPSAGSRPRAPPLETFLAPFCSVPSQGLPSRRSVAERVRMVGHLGTKPPVWKTRLLASSRCRPTQSCRILTPARLKRQTPGEHSRTKPFSTASFPPESEPPPFSVPPDSAVRQEEKRGQRARESQGCLPPARSSASSLQGLPPLRRNLSCCSAPPPRHACARSRSRARARTNSPVDHLHVRRGGMRARRGGENLFRTRGPCGTVQIFFFSLRPSRAAEEGMLSPQTMMCDEVPGSVPPDTPSASGFRASDASRPCPFPPSPRLSRPQSDALHPVASHMRSLRTQGNTDLGESLRYPRRCQVRGLVGLKQTIQDGTGDAAGTYG